MKTFVTLAAAATLSALSFAAPVHAGPWNDVTSAIQSVEAGKYSVIRIDGLEDDRADAVEALAARQEDEVQNAIRSNPTLLRALTDRHVQIRNVVAASPAANGGVAFYLR